MSFQTLALLLALLAASGDCDGSCNSVGSTDRFGSIGSLDDPVVASQLIAKACKQHAWQVARMEGGAVVLVLTVPEGTAPIPYRPLNQFSEKKERTKKTLETPEELNQIDEESNQIDEESNHIDNGQQDTE